MKKIKFEDGTLVSNAKVEIGGTIYDVTPEQYEGTTPLSASNMNAIQDNAEEAIKEVATTLEQLTTDVENKHTYSTEEQVIGTWIDGKPIYRKVIPGLTKNGSIEHNISNLDYVINIKGICKKTNGNFEPIPRLTTGTVSQYGIGIGDISSTSIYFEKGSSVSISESYIIIEYTKTTD